MKILKERKSVTLDPEVIKQVKAQAKRDSKSFSAMIEIMAKSYLETRKL